MSKRTLEDSNNGPVKKEKKELVGVPIFFKPNMEDGMDIEPKDGFTLINGLRFSPNELALFNASSKRDKLDMLQEKREEADLKSHNLGEDVPNIFQDPKFKPQARRVDKRKTISLGTTRAERAARFRDPVWRAEHLNTTPRISAIDWLDGKGSARRFRSGTKLTKVTKYRKGVAIGTSTKYVGTYRIVKNARRLLGSKRGREVWWPLLLEATPKKANSITQRDVTNAFIIQQKQFSQAAAARLAPYRKQREPGSVAKVVRPKGWA